MYWRCIGDMMVAKIRIFFKSSKQNIRNLIHLLEKQGQLVTNWSNLSQKFDVFCNYM